MHLTIGSITLLATLLCLGCGNSGTPRTDGPTIDSAATHGPTPPEQLVNDVVGTWMSQEYCDCLARHRSAFTCKDFSDPWYVVQIERTVSDSLLYSYITTHEGGPEVMLAYDPQLPGFRGQPGEYSDEEVLQVISVDPDRLDLRTQMNAASNHFVRVNGEQELLIGALFNGIYVEEMTGDTVRFLSNGKVTGLPAIDQAIVLTDFTEGLDDRDIVFLYTGENDWTRDAYHYAHSGQELLLYPMLATEEEYVYRMGDVRFKLRKL